MLTTISLSRRYRQQRDPTQHRPEPPPVQMSFREEESVITCMLHQSPSGLHQPLLQTGQRPVLDSSGQRQPPPQIAQIVGQQAQRQPHLIGAKPMTGKPRHLDRLLAFLDPPLRRPAFVVEAHHRPTRHLQVGHNEPQSWEQLRSMKLHLRHHSSGGLPTGTLIEKVLVVTL